LQVPADVIRVEDPNVNLPELRADHVFIIPFEQANTAEPVGTDNNEIAVYLEYQLDPEASVLTSWFAKCAGLTRQLGMPVVLLVIYLQRGDRATFPDEYRVAIGDLSTSFTFTAIRLWEYADRIRSGELAELAPLLVLCEDEPTELIVRSEIALIRNAGFPKPVQTDLLGLALRIASRRIPREALLALFREDIEMIRETGIVEEWIADGEQRGKVQEARNLLIRLGTKRLGDLDAKLRAQIEAVTSVETLENLVVRTVDVETWQDLLA
jgi:hypothetical protein